MAYFLGQIGSPEGLVKGLQDNQGRGILYYSELGMLLAQSGSRKYMSDSLEMLNDLYDCPEYYTKRLVTGSQSIRNIYLNLMGASQLDSLTKYVKESDLISGFLPRFTTVYSEEKRPHLVRRPAPDIKRQNRILSEMNGIRKGVEIVREVDLTPEAWEIFETWAHERYKEALVAPGKLQPMYGRIESHALKFALIFAVCENPEGREVKPKSVQAATACADFVLQSYRRLVLEELAFTFNDKRLKRVSDIIRGKGKASERDIMRGTNYLKRDLDDLIRTLSVAGKIKKEEGPRGGNHYAWLG